MRALVVSAETVLVDAVASALAAEGHTAVIVASAVEAVAAYETDRYPLCIVHDAAGEAPALCRALRGLPHGTDCVLLLLGSEALPERLVEALAAGANDYVALPLE